MDIGTAGQRVSDTAANTGSSTAKGFDLCGVVVGFVLEHQKPVLILAVDFSCNMDRASIDLFAFVQLRQQATFFQDLCTDGSNIHQGLRTLCSLLLAVDLHTGSQVTIISSLNCRIVDFHIVQMGGESGMTAMVRPVCIYHTNLGNGRISVLLIMEIVLQELQVIQIHSKSQGIQQIREAMLIQGNKSVNGCYRLRCSIVNCQCFRLFQCSFPAFHCVDHIILDRSNVAFAQVALKGIDLCRTDHRALTLRQDLDTLCSRVGSLVELTGQRLYSKYIGIGGRNFLCGNIQLRLRKYSLNRIVKQFLGNVFRIIAVKQAHLVEALNTQQIHSLTMKGSGFIIQASFFLYKYSVYQNQFLPAFSAFAPISCR